MPDKIRWGILGTGNIARTFATGLSFLPDAELIAVGSRSQESADAFGDKFAIPRRYPTYEALADDQDVDVVYIGTPHPAHRSNSLLCLNAGKAVLCEKPFTINAREAAEVIDVARSKKLFLMEAMWTRFLPVLARVRDEINAGTIGDVRMVAADFGFRAGVNPEGRLFNLALGGGGLLDVGVYNVSLASMTLGEPDRIAGLAQLGETGVDEQAGMVLGYPSGQIAVLYTAIRTTTPMEATIMGTAGSIRLHSQWWKPTRLTLTRAGGHAEELELPFEGNGYNYQAAAVMEAMRTGKTESAIMPLDETLAIMRTMDRIRAQWGLQYPTE